MKVTLTQEQLNALIEEACYEARKMLLSKEIMSAMKKAEKETGAKIGNIEWEERCKFPSVYTEDDLVTGVAMLSRSIIAEYEYKKNGELIIDTVPMGGELTYVVPTSADKVISIINHFEQTQEVLDI